MSTSRDTPDGAVPRPSGADLRRWRDLLASEREAALLYDSLADADADADAEGDGERAEILRELAEVERRHAAHWAGRLREAGAPVPPPPSRPGLRTRALGTAARRLSLDAVLPAIERAERTDAGLYDADPNAAPGMADDERGHAQTLRAMRSGGRMRSRGGQEEQGRGRIGRRESWHRPDRSGALRAAIFGISDGLVSNTALVMGFAGSGASRSTVFLAGVAGLLAGSFSMAAGEYVSMSGQREMFEREIALEAAELEQQPEEERAELVLIYRAKGLAKEQAAQVADKIMLDKTVALDTLAREELGLDPDELGSPWSAAFSSLAAFAIGATVVVLPYVFAGGTAALSLAVIFALLGMTIVGAVIGVVNGRSGVRGALRQVVSGVLAAGVTFLVGYLIGVQAG